jgi:hypothetical protein|tara:strand:- start:6116 stop:6262 length:147 start_codon:yes stop_codon:yes gene_type:complete
MSAWIDFSKDQASKKKRLYFNELDKNTNASTQKRQKIAAKTCRSAPEL